MAKSDSFSLIKNAGLLVYGLIICAAIVFGFQSCDLLHKHHSDNAPIRTYPDFEDVDELRKHKWYKDKELLEIIWKNQKTLNSRYDNILADIRQESNNTIEKVSAELNFWVAILAFLGVLVPIAITYKGDRALKDMFEAKAKDQDLRLRLFLESAGNRVSSWQEKYQEILRNEKKINKMKEELNLEMNSICLTSIRNNRLLESQTDLQIAHRYLVYETIKRFLRFFEEAINDSSNYSSTDSKWNLVKYSMQYYDMLRTLSIDDPKSKRTRHFSNGEDAAKEMILILMSDFPDETKIKEQFVKVKDTTKLILKRIISPEEI